MVLATFRQFYKTVFMITYLISAFQGQRFSTQDNPRFCSKLYKARYAIPYLREILSDIIAKSNEIKVAMEDATDDEDT